MRIIKQKFTRFILLLICSCFVACCANNSTQQNVTHLTNEPVEIAILMPLSGENEALGRQCDKLIKLGLSDGLKGDIHVTSYDVTQNKQVLPIMDKIIAKNTKVILGPLYSQTVELISEQAKKHGIIIITMSNNPAIADQNLFIFGHAPFKQNEKIINYFLDKNYKHFISLLPAGQHSQAVSKIMQDMVLQKGASLMKSEFYQNDPEAVDKSVKIVSDAVDAVNEMDYVELKPIIYLSDTTQNLNLIFSSILKYNLDKKAIITGDNRIDIEYPEPINIIFTGSLNIINSDVVKRAKDIGINHMSFLYSMAYDLGRMTSSYIGESFDTNYFLARLNSLEPYYGISGNIYFADSIAQREYDIITRTGDKYSK